jgi:hypothetical protein
VSRTHRTQLVVSVIGLCISARSSADESDRVERFAVVLGNNRATGAETLRYADDDALAMHQLFLDANIESRLLVTFDAATHELHPRSSPAGAATLENLEREMAAVQARISTGAARGVATELYFFYSGHGDVEGGEGRLLLEDHALGRGALYELLEASHADRNHVFLDACSSFLVASRRADQARREPVDPAFAARQTPDDLVNVGFVLSSSSDRESHEYERYEGGIVSHELRSALRGAADVDLDGRISYAELAAFMRQANLAIDIPRLRPDPFVAPPGKQDWAQPVLSWSRATVSVRVQGGSTGHFFVENARGERLLDAHPTPGQWLHLHLPGDRPVFIRAQDRTGEYELASAAAVDLTELAPVATPWRRAKGAEQLALSRLFAAPFGHADVLDYERRISGDSPVAPPVALNDEPSPWMRPLGYAALTAATVGVALSTAALVTMVNARGTSQVEAYDSNQRIERYHRLSVIPYVTAATTGILWGWLKLGPSAPSSASVRLAPSFAPGEAFLGFDGRF